MSKVWVYHATEEPKIVDQADAQSYYDDGWKDSPRYFVKTTDFDVDPNDEAAVQNLGEAIEGVADALNGALNLEEMTKDELEEYAFKHFGEDLDKRHNEETMIEEIQALIDKTGSGNGDSG